MIMRDQKYQFSLILVLLVLPSLSLSLEYPEKMSYCVPDCKMAHNSYVNDPIQAKCQYCGEHCSSCNIEFGCEECQAEVQSIPGWVNGLTNQTSNDVSFKETFKLCQTSYVTTPQSSPAAENCLVYYKDSTTYPGITYEVCYQCADGYFLQANQIYDSNIGSYLPSCSKYQGSGKCKVPLSTIECELCEEGYDEVVVNGEQVCGRCLSENSLYNEAIRCELSDINTVKALTGCKDGYINNATGSCVTRCPIGQYGKANYNQYGTIDSSYCMSCSDDCFECSSEDKCTSCKNGFYLDTQGNKEITTGICMMKSIEILTQTIYVANFLNINLDDPDSIDGSKQKPFNFIQDALTYALEIGAPFSSADIKILLLPGPHAMLRSNNYKPYMPTKQDQYSQTTKITIDSESGQQIKLHYKLRDKWTFDIGAQFTLKNIVFDAIDSIILPSNEIAKQFECLSDGSSNCCQISETNGLIEPQDTCYFVQQPTDNCQIGKSDGGSMFKFQKYTQSNLNISPTLTLENVVFKNFMYEFNSFIDLDDVGGHIILKNTSFINFNTCGAIIRNKKALFMKDLAQNSETATSSQLHLSSYEFRTNYLYNINVWYSSCDAGKQLKYLNSSQFQDPYSALGSKTHPQLKSLISITNHCFNKNFGYFDNQLIYIRARGQNGKSIYSTVPSQDNLFCTGYHIIANSFTMNTGCVQYSGGLLNMQCVDYDQQPISNDDIYSHGTVSTLKTDYLALNSYAYITSNYTYIYDIKTQKSIKVDMNTNTLKSNYYYRNTVTGGSALVDLSSFPRVRVESEYFYQNSDACFDVIQYYATSAYSMIDENQSSLILMMKNATKFPSSNLGQGILKMRKVFDIKIYNTTFDYNWFIETLQFDEKRSNALSFQDFYGSLELNQVSFIRQYGINNEFLSIELSWSVPLTDDRSSGFSLPLIKFGTNDKVLVTINSNYSSTVSTKYNYLYYWQNPTNMNKVTIFPNFTNSENIFARSVIYTNFEFQQNTCAQCTLPMLEFMADSFKMTNSYLYSFNNFYKSTFYMSSAEIFRLKIRKPYQIDSNQTVITPSIVFSNTTATNFNFLSGGRLFYFLYVQQDNEVDVTSLQNYSKYRVNFTDLTAKDFNSYGNAPFMIVEIDTISMYMNDLDIWNMYAGNLKANTGFGGFTIINSVGELYLNVLYAQNCLVKQTTETNGGGSFLYYNQNKDFNLTIVSATMQVDSSYGQTDPFAFLSTMTYNQGSLFHINTQLSKLNLVANYNQIYQVTNVNSGGIFLLTNNGTFLNYTASPSGSYGWSNISMLWNQFQYSNALSGGTLYCRNCYITECKNNYFYYAYSAVGADIFINRILNNPVFDGNQHDQSYTLSSTYPGIVRITDSQTSTDPLIITLTSSSYLKRIGWFFYCETKQGLISVQSTRPLEFYINQYIVEGNYATKGPMIFDYDDTVNSTVKFYFENSWIKNNKGLGGIGGKASTLLQNSYTSVKNCTFNTNQPQKTYASGGLFQLYAKLENILEINSATIASTLTQYNGSVAYMNGISNVVSITNSSSFTTNTANLNGGLIGSIGTTFLMTIDSSTITSSKSLQSGGIAYVTSTNTTININNSTISSSSSTNNNGGLFYLTCSVYSLNIINSKIISSSAKNGGLIYAVASEQNILTQNSTISQQTAITNGAALFLTSAQLINIQVTQGSMLSTMSNKGEGGFAYLSGVVQNLVVQDSSISGLYSYSGGLIKSREAQQLKITLQNNLLQYYNSTKDGSIVSVSSITQPSSGPRIATQVNLTMVSNTISNDQYSLWFNFPEYYKQVMPYLTNLNATFYTAFNFEAGVQGLITSQSNIYQRVYMAIEGAFFKLNSNISFSDYGSSFKEILTMRGVILCDGCRASFNQTKFQDIFGVNGSAINANNSFELNMTQISVMNTQSTNYGGFMTVNGTGISTLNFNGITQNISYSQASVSGGFIYANNSNFQMTLNNVNISNMYSGLKGGFLYVKQMNQLMLMNLNISNASSQNGSFVFSMHQGFKINIQNTIIRCNNEKQSYSNQVENLRNSIANMGSLFDLKFTSQVTSINNTYQNCLNVYEGSIFRLHDTLNFYDENSTYQDNRALTGGVISLKNITANFNRSQILNNFARNAGSLYIQQQVNATFNNISVNGSIALQDGGFIQNIGTIIVEDQSQQIYNNNLNFTGTESIIKGTQSLSGNGGMIYLNDILTKLTFNDSINFQDSYAYNSGGLIYNQLSHSITIQNTTIQNSTSFNSDGSILYSIDQKSIISLQNSYFMCNYMVQTNLDSQFQKNNSTIGAAIYVLSNQQGLISSQNTYENCQLGNLGGVMHLENTHLEEMGGSLYLNNSALNGGVIYCKNCTLNVTNTTFDSNSAINGGVIFAQDPQNLTFNDVTFNNSYTYNSGAIIYSEISTQQLLENSLSEVQIYSNISFTGQTLIQNSRSLGNGGSLYLDSQYLDVFMNYQPVELSNSTSVSGSGGVFFIKNLRKLYLTNSTFQTYQSQSKGSFLYSESNTIDLQLLNNTFECAIIQDIQTLDIFQYNSVSSFSRGGAFYIKSAGLSSESNYIMSYNNKYLNCFYSDMGGAFSLIDSKFVDQDSVIVNNGALQGGAILCQNCELNLNSTYFYNNFGRDGGVFYVSQDIALNAINITVNKSTAFVQGGVLSINQDTVELALSQVIKVLSLKNLTIIDSYSLDKGGFMYLNYQNLQITLQNINITNSSASQQGGVYYINKINTFNIMSPTHYTLINAGLNGKFLYSGFQDANINLEGIQIDCNEEHRNLGQSDVSQHLMTLSMTSLGLSEVMQIRNAKTINSLRSTISNCHYGKLGGIYSLHKVDSFIDQSSIYTNNSALRGGFIYSESSNATVKNAKLTNFVGDSGGIFRLKYGNNLLVQETQIRDVYANNMGGMLYSYQYQYDEDDLSSDYTLNYDHQITIKDSYIVNIISSSAALMYINNYNLTDVNLEGNYVYNLTSTTDNGAIFLENLKYQGNFKIYNDISISSLGQSETQLLIGDKMGYFSQIYSPNDGAIIYSRANANIILSNSIFECNEVYDSTLEDRFLSTSTTKQGGAFSISYANKVQSVMNTFRNCYAANKGGIFYLYQTFNFTDKLSTFYHNSAIFGGTIYSDNSFVDLTSSKISYSKAVYGGVFFLSNYNKLTISTSDISEFSSLNQGGFLSTINYDLESYSKSLVSLISTTIQQGYSKVGGFAYVDNINFNLKLNKATVQNIQAYQISGFIYAVKMQSMSLISSTIQDIKSETISMMYSQSQGLVIEMNSTTIVCDSSYSSSEASTYLEDQLYTTIGTFAIRNAKNITLYKNSFSHCGIAETGGIFSIFQSSLYDQESKFYENSAVTGGVIWAQESYIVLKKTQIYENYASRGGVFFLSSDSYISMTSVSVYQNYAYQDAGVIYMETGSLLYAVDTTFSKNYAGENSVLQVLEGNKTNNITFNQCTFENNKADKNTMSIIYGNVLIQSCIFSKNLANSRSKNIFAGFSNIFIINTQFRGSIATSGYLAAQTDNTIGSFIFTIIDINLYIYNCYFSQGVSKYGGAIYISGDSYINIIKTQFSENYAGSQGGAIYATGFTEFNITGETKFLNNLAYEFLGDDVYASNTKGVLRFDQVTINNPGASQSVYSADVSLVINKSTISNTGQLGKNFEAGSALLCSYCNSILINQSIFSNCVSINGGAVYFEEFPPKKESVKDKYKIMNSVFTNNTGVAGGSLYLYNPQIVRIYNTSFTNNKALNTSIEQYEKYQGSGGAIFYQCIDDKCEVSIDSKSKFIQNRAGRQGGAIHWEVLEPIFDKGITFQNNKADLYGNDISCFSQNLKKIDEELYYQMLTKAGVDIRMRYLEDLYSQQSLEISTQLDQQRSGGTIPGIFMALVDKYGQIVGVDSNSKVRVALSTDYITSSDATKYSPIIEGQQQFVVVGGVVQIQDIQFTGTPGQKYGLLFQTDGIDITKKSNQQYLNNIAAQDIEFRVDVQLRDCEIGEQFTVVGKCEQCQNGTSFSIVQMTSPGSCQSCPTEKANCYGGSNIGPKPGYWRKNNVTSNFIQCSYPPACLGMIPPRNNPRGTCEEGYQGILCTDCSQGYSRQGDFKCAECPAQGANVARLIFIFIAVLGLVVFLIRSTLLGAKEKKNLTSIFLKIMMNHLQLILLTASFNFDWPTLVVEFFSSVKPVAQVSTQIFSFDCFLNIKGNANDYNETSNIERIFFQKLIILALLPFILLFASWSFWSSFYTIKKYKRSYKGKLISTLVIVLFLVHPSIVQFMFNNFRCIDVDGDSRIQDDLYVVCWDSTHTIISYFVALPCIFVWGLGIPFFAFILLTKDRKNLEQIEVRERLGFLYRGFRAELYYWEIVIMYRKIVLIFISVFISAYGVVAQALIVFIVLIVFMIINSKKYPFATLPLNDLETLSLITSMITVYCGLFFVSNTKQSQIDSDPELKSKALQLSESTQIFFFVVIVVSNIIFFTYWGFKMFQELKQKLMKKMPKLYLFFCACQNEMSFKKDIRNMQIQDENEALREKFIKALESIKTLQIKGDIMLNQANIEKFQHYLMSDKIVKLMKSVDLQEVNKQQRISKRYKRINTFKGKFNGERLISENQAYDHLAMSNNSRYEDETQMYKEDETSLTQPNLIHDSQDMNITSDKLFKRQKLHKFQNIKRVVKFGPERSQSDIQDFSPMSKIFKSGSQHQNFQFIKKSTLVEGDDKMTKFTPIKQDPSLKHEQSSKISKNSDFNQSSPPKLRILSPNQHYNHEIEDVIFTDDELDNNMQQSPFKNFEESKQNLFKNSLQSPYQSYQHNQEMTETQLEETSFANLVNNEVQSPRRMLQKLKRDDSGISIQKKMRQVQTKRAKAQSNKKISMLFEKQKKAIKDEPQTMKNNSNNRRQSILQRGPMTPINALKNMQTIKRQIVSDELQDYLEIESIYSNNTPLQNQQNFHDYYNQVKYVRPAFMGIKLNDIPDGRPLPRVDSNQTSRSFAFNSIPDNEVIDSSNRIRKPLEQQLNQYEIDSFRDSIDFEPVQQDLTNSQQLHTFQEQQMTERKNQLNNQKQNGDSSRYDEFSSKSESFDLASEEEDMDQESVSMSRDNSKNNTQQFLTLDNYVQQLEEIDDNKSGTNNNMINQDFITTKVQFINRNEEKQQYDTIQKEMDHYEQIYGNQIFEEKDYNQDINNDKQ
eukprot:403349735